MFVVMVHENCLVNGGRLESGQESVLCSVER